MVAGEKLINEYYSEQPFAENFPLDTNKPYYPVYTDFMYSFTFDFQEDDEAREIVFDSFDAYKQMMKESKDVTAEEDTVQKYELVITEEDLK